MAGVGGSDGEGWRQLYFNNNKKNLFIIKSIIKRKKCLLMSANIGVEQYKNKISCIKMT